VHEHWVPAALHVPVGEVTSLQLPFAQEYVGAHIGIPGLVSWQCMASKLLPVPVQGPFPMQFFCVASLMHLPLTEHALSLVHQQHWYELEQGPGIKYHPSEGPPTHTVLAGHPAGLRLHVGKTAEQPALSTAPAPLQVPLPASQRDVLQPPLFKPWLLHWESVVQRQ
jgi:hypothetical protein